MKKREETVKEQRFGARGGGKDALKATSPSRALAFPVGGSPKFGESGHVCGAERGAAGEDGRTDAAYK